MQKTIFSILLFCVYCSVATAKITLTSIWGDNMVLQQNSIVVFTGESSTGKRVSATPSWNNRTVYADHQSNKQFTLKIETPTYGGPYTITFSDGDKLILKNILIGEVWFCSGQSNMEMPVKGYRGQPVFGSQPYIVSADSQCPIRLFTVKNSWSTIPKEDGIEGGWSELSPESVANFSATAYFFGNLLQKTLNIPVGLINCSWGASKIEAWMSRETLQQIKEVELPDVNNKEFGWPAGTPTLLWNAMVHPWQGFPIKGIIWYQGEANSPNPELYKTLFPAMVKEWRSFFNQPRLPFYYVQIAPWQSEGGDKFDWALFRQCQLDLMKDVSNVGMVITADAGSEKFIHPPHKIKVGERLAYWALAKTYGVKGFTYSGPIYKQCKMNGNAVEVDFDFGEDGLIPENEPIKGFELVGKDGEIYPASAEIINSTSIVKVWNEAVIDSVEIRYCFRNYMVGNLQNNAGIPAAPFRAIIYK